MAERIFFSVRSWVNKVIDFDGTEWQIVNKVDEKHHQGDEEEWEAYKHRRPMMAIGLFECVNPKDPRYEWAFMKIYMQIPYADSEYGPPANRAEQALPDAEMDEEIALRTLTQQGCKSSPPLINWKRDTQDNTGLVPGGFIVYLVTCKLPGILLDRDDYWTLSYNERTEIRLAFRDAYRDCVRCGIVHTWGFLGTSLLWDHARKKIFILGWSNCEPATEEDAWDDNEWVGWGFGRPVKDLHRKMTGPLPPNMIRGRRDKTVYEL